MYAIKRFIITMMFLCVTPFLSANAESGVGENIGDWRIISGQEKGKNYCYAYTTPFRTKAFDGDFRGPAYLILVSKSPKEISVGVNPGFIVDKHKGFTMKVNGRVHLLDLKLSQNSWTSSAFQDVAILDDMIEEDNFIEVRSYDMKDHVALDYYSLKGFPNVYNKLTTSCHQIQKAS